MKTMTSSKSYPIFSDSSQVKEYYDRYCAKARHFYAGVSAADARQLGVPQQTMLRAHAGEVLLLLAGLKPCILVNPLYVMKKDANGHHIAKRLVENVIRPIFQSVPNVELVEIVNPIVEVDTGAVHQDAWLMRNRLHPDYSKADIFLNHGGNVNVSRFAIGLALGYPVHSRKRLLWDVEYMYGESENDCCMEYQGNGEGCDEYVRHFVQCRDACKRILELHFHLGGKRVSNRVMDLLNGLDSVRCSVGLRGLTYYINNVPNGTIVGESAVRRAPFDVNSFLTGLTDRGRVSDALAERMKRSEGDTTAMEFDGMVALIARIRI